MADQQDETELIMQRLRERFAQDTEPQLVPRVRRWLADPLKPVDEQGRFRPNPAALVVAVVGLIAVIAFLYFGYWAS